MIKKITDIITGKRLTKVQAKKLGYVLKKVFEIDYYDSVNGGYYVYWWSNTQGKPCSTHLFGSKKAALDWLTQHLLEVEKKLPVDKDKAD